ncbi:putative secreted protein with PEP-CTERM sorting signal [Pseudoduganella flava]|uniref:Putative secreted protein with PEP-CTERM sorting signal n=1 Tax=Pseudoduganella flava TaxID=871742 RepID=A0A562PFN0_9BURK|nr:hypothetical protein [Pseudoduganella flava]QGZ38956.1 hypothetical protein GO485_07795 [Pseudoduganella flava]TWI43040.1 putative secreted protein with PEP-CTERM sorting signal [Pseudoduganella flava]
MATLFRPVCGSVVALLALLSTPLAHATGSASASISNVQLGALDLTPADGAAPGFDLLAVAPSMYAGVYGGTADYYLAGYPAPGVPASLALTHGSAGASAYTEGLPGDVMAQALGTASLGEFGYLSASSNQALHLMLRPHTVLTIAGHLTTLATRSNGSDESYDVGGMAYVGIVDENGYTMTSFARQSYSYADLPDYLALDEDFTLAFANGSAADAPVTVYFQALANASRFAMPVPEPARPVMLTAGLLAMGMWARRGHWQRRATRPFR